MSSTPAPAAPAAAPSRVAQLGDFAKNTVKGTGNFLGRVWAQVQSKGPAVVSGVALAVLVASVAVVALGALFWLSPALFGIGALTASGFAATASGLSAGFGAVGGALASGVTAVGAGVTSVLNAGVALGAAHTFTILAVGGAGAALGSLVLVARAVITQLKPA